MKQFVTPHKKVFTEWIQNGSLLAKSQLTLTEEGDLLARRLSSGPPDLVWILHVK